jgi:hypothetical protein
MKEALIGCGTAGKGIAANCSRREGRSDCFQAQHLPSLCDGANFTTHSRRPYYGTVLGFYGGIIMRKIILMVVVAIMIMMMMMMERRLPPQS